MGTLDEIEKYTLSGCLLNATPEDKVKKQKKGQDMRLLF